MSPQKKIGFWSSTSLVVGNMIGSGIFLLPSTLAAYGGISLVGWLASSIGALLIAVVFGNLARIAPHTTGGPYAYTRLGLGEFPAFWVAWGYWISIWATNAAIAVALVGYLETFFPYLKDNSAAAIMTGLSFIWLFTYINSKNLKTVAFIQLITTTLKITPILLIGCIGIFYLNTDHYQVFNLSGSSNLTAIINTTTLTFFAFLGMESATIPSSKIKNATTTIGRATMTGTFVTALLYILSSIAIMGIVPPEILANSNAPFAEAANLFWGVSAKYVVAGGAIIATLGALNGWILMQGQIPLAAANDKLFPKVFGKTNTNESPIIGIVISSILVSTLMTFNYSKSLVEAFTFMMKLSTLSVLTPYLFATASFVILMFANKEKGLLRKLIICSLVFIFLLLIIIGCGQDIVFLGFLLLVLGIPVYILLKINNSDQHG